MSLSPLRSSSARPNIGRTRALTLTDLPPSPWSLTHPPTPSLIIHALVQTDRVQVPLPLVVRASLPSDHIPKWQSSHRTRHLCRWSIRSGLRCEDVGRSERGRGHSSHVVGSVIEAMGCGIRPCARWRVGACAGGRVGQRAGELECEIGTRTRPKFCNGRQTHLHVECGS